MSWISCWRFCEAKPISALRFSALSFSRVVQSSLKAALVGGLVAQIEGEAFFLADLAGDIETGVLELHGAATLPEMLGQALYQNVFGDGGGLVLGA